MVKVKRTVLVIGSGPIRIGQAAEFDYSGSQACRALKEEGCKTILLNSNPATIQTDVALADVVYLRPLTVEVVEAILETHSPDGVIATLGGQSGLNLCVECENNGLWSRYGVEILGTSVDSILRAEGREAFRDCVASIGEPVVESSYVKSVEESLEFSKSTPFPLVVRPDFTLGGTGGGVARNREELVHFTGEGLHASPVSRVLVERYLEGWREIEAEVVRDGLGNSICVCSMENVDPMGVHTGDSVVVSPVLTLTDRQWQRLRSSALNIVDSLDIKGACNVQFGFSPDGEDFAVIEVNPRASRSSALASKATGYPIARMAAKIALGRSLAEMPNPVTGGGSAMSEPVLDYVVVKVPRWPFDTFQTADRTLGTRMKATGEVLAIGLSFEEAWLKAMRSLRSEPFKDIEAFSDVSDDKLWEEVLKPTDRRLRCIMELLRREVSVDEIEGKTAIHGYFISSLLNIVQLESDLSGRKLSDDILKRSKVAGISDSGIAFFASTRERDVFKRREALSLMPGYREVDGCAGETPAGSGYWYGSYKACGDPFKREPGRSVAVIGSGAIRIGQGVEFDYCCVKAVEALKKRGIRAIMINDNPETVSTDHDISDALYVEPLVCEDVISVLKREETDSIFASFGGQTSLRLGLELEERGVTLLGASGDVISTAEDRGRFASLLDRLGIAYPRGESVCNVEEGLKFAQKLGFPLMVRPSFVIGGVAMRLVSKMEDLGAVLKDAFAAVPGQEVLLDRFLAGQEFEVDSICDGSDVLVPGIFEHLDPAGTHSGDSMAMFPDLSLSSEQREEVVQICSSLAYEMGIKGFLNVQFVLHEGELNVIEANPRASRTVPIAAKVTGLPLVDYAVGVALGEPLKGMATLGLHSHNGPISVKMPVFSTEKLPGVDTKPGPRMSSTGESLGVGDNLTKAFMDAWGGAGWTLPDGGKVLFSVCDDKKSEIFSLAALFQARGWTVEGTSGTAASLAKWGIECSSVSKGKDLMESIISGDWDLIINVPGPDGNALADGFDIRRSAIESSVPCIFSLEAARVLAAAL